MKRIFSPLIGLFLLANASIAEATDVKEYVNQSLGVTFDYPEALTIDEKNSKEIL